MKTLVHPTTGQTFKMGRNKPISVGPRLSLSNYLFRKFPAAPASIDYSSAADAFLRNILGNDVAGDCTCAAAFHIAGVLLANAKQPIPFTSADAMTMYKKLSGWNGIPDDISDTGLDELTVLNYWCAQGLDPGKHQITGAIKIDPTDVGEVQAALWLFENVYFAMGLPDEWVSPMPSASGFTWDAAGPSDPENGHAFCGVGYNAAGVQIDTWGMIGTMTWAAVGKYPAVYTGLGNDIIDRASQKAPNGFNWTQLLSDLQSMGANE